MSALKLRRQEGCIGQTKTASFHTALCTLQWAPRGWTKGRVGGWREERERNRLLPAADSTQRWESRTRCIFSVVAAAASKKFIDSLFVLLPPSAASVMFTYFVFKQQRRLIIFKFAREHTWNNNGPRKLHARLYKCVEKCRRALFRVAFFGPRQIN